MMPISSTTVNGCDCPGTSPVGGVLIDGVIPSIDTTQRGTWARELFTVNRNGRDSIMIGFQFSDPFLKAVELAYFDCGIWEAGITSISIHSSPTFPWLTPIDTDIGVLSLEGDNVQSCTSLSTITILTQRVGQFNNYFIDFSIANQLNWLHLGEIKFSDETPTTAPSAMTETTTENEGRIQCTFR